MLQETGLESARGQAGASSQPVSGPFLLIQTLRGVAALMVVWHHATLMENERLDPARGVWLSGAGGVDIFFVISGFVMVFSSWSLRTAAHPMRTFLQRRIERVVPMYWLVTTVKVIAACLVPSIAARLFSGLWHLVASYLFLPSVNGAGAVHPVLIVGWTLNYEAAFYVLVAIGLGWRLRLVPYLMAVLPALGLVGWLLRGTLPTVLSEVNPLLLEFAYGVLLAGGGFVPGDRLNESRFDGCSQDDFLWVNCSRQRADGRSRARCEVPRHGVGPMLRISRESCGWLVSLSLMAPVAVGQAAPDAKTPPKTWVDASTGHRVFRLTDEPGSTGFYFNNNAYSPDGKMMIYTAPDGIHVLELATKTTRLLVPNPPRVEGADPMANYRRGVHAIVVGHKTASVFYSQMDPATKLNTLYKADMNTGAITKLTSLPEGATGVATVNADETLAAGTMNDGPAVAPEYGANRVSATGTPRVQQPTGASSGTLVQPEGKGEMMERRLASRQPLILFTINLQTGKMTTLLHSTDWVNHLLFSPADPTLLMYCHEGPWQKVDRIWTIRTDGTQNTLIHKRTFAQEIAGHEFWGIDGKTLWYDWQPIKGEDFYLAGYDVATHRRRAFHMERNEWSIHFNVTGDESLFTGDGGDPGQVAKAPDGEYIELFRPEMKKVDGINTPEFIQPGMFRAEHLVNMAKHNYKLEPNVRFSPDKSMVIFTSNMYGPSYVFGVEVAKAGSGGQ